MENCKHTEEEFLQNCKKLLELTGTFRENLISKGFSLWQEYEKILEEQKEVCQRMQSQKGYQNLPEARSAYQQILLWNKEICTRIQAEQKKILTEIKECTDTQKALLEYRAALKQDVNQIDQNG